MLRHLGNPEQAKKGPRLPTRFHIIRLHFSQLNSVGSGFGRIILLPSLSIENVVLQSG